MPRSIDTGSNDVKHLTWQFHLKTWIYKSEACSMPNQRPPNSFHHENALLSDLVINETPKLRTQPIRAWHSRNERLTPHIPAQAELPPQECGDNSTKQGGMPKLPLGDSEKKKKKKPPPCSTKKTKKNEPTSLKRSRVHAQLNDGFWHQRWTSTPVPKKLDRFRSVLWPHTHLTDMIHLEWQFVSNVDN